MGEAFSEDGVFDPPESEDVEHPVRERAKTAARAVRAAVFMDFFMVNSSSYNKC